MVNSGVNHQAAAKPGGCQLCKPVAPAGQNAPPMPSRPPEFGYQPCRLRAAVPGAGQDRSARPAHQSVTKPARPPTPATGTTRSRPRRCASSPRPSAPARIPPEQVSQMITQTRWTCPARRMPKSGWPRPWPAYSRHPPRTAATGAGTTNEASPRPHKYACRHSLERPHLPR